MNWNDVAKRAIDLGFPVIGSIIGGPSGAIFGSSLAKMIGINPDPESVMTAPWEMNKFQAIEDSIKIAQLENDDRQSARMMNSSIFKLSDEIIKCYMIGFLSLVVFVCLYAIVAHKVEGEEANILYFVLGNSFAALAGTVMNFYWGTSKSSFDKNFLLGQKK